MKDLHLHLKFEYFDAIERGEKTEEYRGLHWLDKLKGKRFGRVILWRGYTRKWIARKWVGFERKTITHKHFGNVPAEVLAIDVSRRC